MGRGIGVAVAAGIALGAQLTLLTPAGSFPGDRDGGFGNCGRAATDPARFQGAASDVTTQTDGKIVVGGIGGAGGASAPIVARFKSNGAFDRSFAGGFVSVAGGDSSVKVAVQGDGMILGATTDLLVRLRPDGTFDPTFGDGGRTSTTTADQGLLVQPDGRIVSIGDQNHVARFTSTGVPDPTFATTGQVALPLTVAALALQPDDKLLVGGSVPNGSGTDFAMTRLNVDGTTDTSFGTNGLVVDDLKPEDRLTGLATMNGGVVLSGSANNAVALIRHNSDGSRDTSFGLGGIVLARFSTQIFPVGLSATSNDRLVVAGTAAFADDLDVFVLRYTSSGLLDRGFGFGGLTLVDDGRYPRATDSTVRPDGRVVAAGHFFQSDKTTLALWRFQPDGSTASYPDLGYVLDGYGGLHSVSSGCAGTSPAPVGAPYWRGWDIARDVVTLYGGEGYVLEGYGGLHGFNFYASGAVTRPPPTYGGPYWSGWDIARSAAVLPDESGGYVLDGYGGLHPFGIYGARPPTTTGGPYWRGWDIARGAVVLPNGQGGYVLDGYGGIHRFAINGGPLPPPAVGGPSWPGWDIARSITLLPDASGGYVLDGYGGLHPFSIGNAPRPPGASGGPYWRGWDIARGVSLFR